MEDLLNLGGKFLLISFHLSQYMPIDSHSLVQQKLAGSWDVHAYSYNSGSKHLVGAALLYAANQWLPNSWETATFPQISVQ